MKRAILFLIFNRPETTRRVFERIREVRPARLYVAADGAREGRGDEAERCAEARAVIEGVDWECEVKTLFRDRNLGCKVAVSEALTWFFEQEEAGIILEDDCLPDLSFFPFCDELLERYKDDERVGHIGGNCFLPGVIDRGLSYDFCSFSLIWGWASWRRAWRTCDTEMRFYTEVSSVERKRLFNNLREEIYFSSFISDTLQGRNNTWDVQYLFSLRHSGMLSVHPAVNLVTNIGLNVAGATHVSRKNKRLYVPSEAIAFPLEHPSIVARNVRLDEKIVRNNFFSWIRLARYIVGRIR
jgi:hypothetical protein